MDDRYHQKPNDISKYFIGADNAEYCLSLISEATSRSIKHKSRRRVTSLDRWPKSGEAHLQEMPECGTGLEDLIEELDHAILGEGMNFASMGYLGFPDAANSIAAIIASIASDIFPQNLINSKRWAPTATYIEIATVNWLRSILGFEVDWSAKSAIDCSGFATTGGVLSNAIALLVARENLCPGFGQDNHSRALDVIIPESIDHYSIRTSARWLGFGESHIRRAAVRHYCYHQASLEALLQENKNSDRGSIVVAYAGDSRTQTIDDLSGLADLCERHGAWLHIDACHGFQLAFSSKLAPRLKGIERAHSVTADPHKVLWVPHSLSYVLFRKPDYLRPIAGASDLVTTEEMSLGAITPFIGTKRFDSLKLWFLVKHLGRSGIASLIEQRHQLALEFADYLTHQPDFLVLNDRIDINGVTFLHLGRRKSIADYANNPQSILELNRFNLFIHDTLLNEG
jgi:L-2,4-diaminobutyrate decarboxylase